MQIHPRMASLRQVGVLISFFLQSTGGQVYEQRHVSLRVRKRGRILWGRTLWMIMITIQWKSSPRNSFNMESELTSPYNILTNVLINLNRISQSWLYSACGFTLLKKQNKPVQDLILLRRAKFGVLVSWLFSVSWVDEGFLRKWFCNQRGSAWGVLKTIMMPRPQPQRFWFNCYRTAWALVVL